MQGNGVVDIGSYTLLAEPGRERVPLAAANDKLVVDMPGLVSGWFRGDNGDRSLSQTTPVIPGIPLADCRPRIEVWKFHPEHRCLHRIESGVYADPLMQIRAGTAVDAQRAKALGQRLVAGRDH